MKEVTVIGTLKEQTKLMIQGHPIATSALSKDMIGKRLECTGRIRGGKEMAPYFEVLHYTVTDKPDSNLVTVSGVVVQKLEPRSHPKHGRSALLRIQQEEKDVTSRVLITVIGSRIEELGFSNLSLGQQVAVRGYILYHRTGLHVLYCGKEVGINE